jgi:hypothetical protein
VSLSLHEADVEDGAVSDAADRLDDWDVEDVVLEDTGTLRRYLRERFSCCALSTLLLSFRASLRFSSFPC